MQAAYTVSIGIGLQLLSPGRQLYFCKRDRLKMTMLSYVTLQKDDRLP